MVRFTCPKCRKLYEATDERAARKSLCARCGQRLQIPAAPSTKTVLGSVVDPAGTAPMGSVPSPDALPELLAPPAATTVRLTLQGLPVAKFKSDRPVGRILAAVDEMLRSMGLDLEGSGFVSGALRHSQSWAATIAVDGAARQRAKKAEFVIALNWRSTMTGVAILIAIFLFPVGLILAILFLQMGQAEVKRIVEDAFWGLRADLEND